MTEKVGLNHFVYNAPKAELHVHLEGSLSLEFWKRHCKTVHREIKEFNSSSKKSLSLFLKCMELIHRSLSSPNCYYLATLDLLDQLIKENIKYAEITWAPGGIYEFHGIPPERAFFEIKKALNYKKGDIDCRLLVDIIRNQNVSIAEIILKWLSTAQPEEVVGINFGGDEERFKVDPFESIFKQAKAIGLGITIHAGESVNEDRLIEAVRKVKPNRIGHGTSLKSVGIKQEVIEMGLHIEACPNSNYYLSYLQAPELHPVFEDQRIKASINTDDRTFFSPTLSCELTLLINKGVLDLKKIGQMQLNVIHDSFAKSQSPLMNEVSNFWRKYAFL